MTDYSKHPIGAGLGFRRELMSELVECKEPSVDFFEIAPENWMNLGGRFARDLRSFTERFAFTCHGLSLSLGGTEPLDVQLLKSIKCFMDEHNISLYTEHLSWCSDDGHLYDLLPIPCTEEAIRWVSKRIQQAQDVLGMQIGIENASYYFNPPGSEMKEEAFISEIIREAGCFLHLDVNNVYVNSQNFGFDPLAYLDALPLKQTGYIHVAGHFTEHDGIIVDTHGARVIDPVWSLLEYAYQQMPSRAVPTCLERDFNFPPLTELLSEVQVIREYQNAASKIQLRSGTHD